MADLPQFRSLSQIVGDLALTFLSELDQSLVAPGTKDLKPGSPFLAIFEAVGQSQLRTQQQTLLALDANDIDNATDDVLDRIGARYRVRRRGETYARGKVDISDTSFTKVVAKLYQAAAAPIPGTRTIYVTDASAFPATGSIYLGRGTSNAEGPIPYSGVSYQGARWAITLSTGTQKYHALTEQVILAQGGDRVVSAGQVVGTLGDGAKFQTTVDVTLLDGETQTAGIPVVCQETGTAGNVPAGAIKDVVSPAFQGMMVTNPLPIQNGLGREDDGHYRERIKQARTAAQRGTARAIESHTYGVSSTDESSTVTTATLVQRRLQPTSLVIDDGSGYEEKDAGIANEVLVDSANGGETDFFLTWGRPVAKASIETVAQAPFALTDTCALTVLVGGIQQVHYFSAASFRNIGSATAYEVVASINANPDISFRARTVDAGKRVAIFARAEQNDDIEVIVTSAGVDANQVLRFPAGPAETLRLYRNDRLLHKDGQKAVLLSQRQSDWGTIVDGADVSINVDGTGFSVSYAIHDIDFVNLKTGYTKVSAENSLAAWAAVLNSKLPGITVRPNGAYLEFESNLGSSSKASIAISASSSLVTSGMFHPRNLTAQGLDRDYILNRNLGQVELVEGLVPGDRLTAGTPFTRAYLESAVINDTYTVEAGGANLWFVVDGQSQFVQHALNANHFLGLSKTGIRLRYTSIQVNSDRVAVQAFSNVKPGDWAIFSYDIFGNSTYRGAWRVCAAGPSWFEVERDLGVPDFNLDSTTLAYDAVRFVRTDAIPQHVVIPEGIYTETSLAAAIQVQGAHATASDSHVRVTTNTYGTNGDICLASADQPGRRIFGDSVQVENNPAHQASAESGNGHVGTPAFQSVAPTVVAGQALTLDQDLVRDYRGGLIEQLLWLRPLPEGTGRYSTLNGQTATLDTIVDTTHVMLKSGSTTVIPITTAASASPDRCTMVSLYRFGPESSLDVVLDQDPVGKGFSVPMFRRLKADGAVPYGQTIRLVDLDLLDQNNQPTSLSKAFGQSFDFGNFALHSKARGITNGDAPTKAVLWRLRDFCGAVGRSVSYAIPPAAATPVSVAAQDTGNVAITLGTGVARDIGTVLEGQKVSVGTNGRLRTSYTLTGAVRAGNAVTVSVAGADDGGLQVGQQVYVYVGSADFPAGLKTILAVDASGFQYAEVGSNATANVSGYVWFSNVTPVDLTNAQQGDLITGLFSKPVRIATKTDNKSFLLDTVDLQDETTGTKDVPDSLRIFPLAKEPTDTNATLTVAALVEKVNGLGNCVEGVLLGAGSGIPTATSATLEDGLHQVRSAAWNPAAQNYDVTLKWSPNPALVGVANDWAAEEFRLVPTTVENVASFLSVPAVSGLSLSGATLQVSSRGRKFQVTTGTEGSVGAVQVTGGTANELRLDVVGGGLTTNDLVRIPVRKTTELSTVPTLSWCVVDAPETMPKQTDWDAATTVTIDSSGRVTFGGGTAQNRTASAVVNGDWYVTREGRYVSYRNLSGASLAGSVGSWVTFQGDPTKASVSNLGTFQVLNQSGSTVWVDNPAAVDELCTLSKVDFFSYDSIMPGDEFQVATDLLGAANQGIWQVESVNSDGSLVVPGLTAKTATALGGNIGLVRCMPAKPLHSLARIKFIAPTDDPDIFNVYMDQWAPNLAALTTAGSVITLLDRLDFPTQMQKGRDGYRYNTGLVAEVNRVIYGDEGDDETYPGVVAAGADIAVTTPLLRRVSISVAIRGPAEAKSKVQAAIAEVINSSGGKPVAISKYLEAAGKVARVESVIPLSPRPTPGNDTIPVQPGERAAILDLDADIQVSLIGQ